MTWTWSVSKELIEKAAWSVTSADKAYHWLKEQGYDVRRADVRGAWREFNQKTGYEGPISQWDPSRKIPKAWIVERETVEAEGFMHFFKVKYIDPETGEEKEAGWSAVTDELMPFSEFDEELDRNWETYSLVSGWILISTRPAGVFKLVPKK